MVNRLILILIMFCLTAVFAPISHCAENRDTLYQVSTLGALMKGDYDGEVDIESLERQGDFGIGTFDCLDGEMVVLDGEFYQVRFDGVTGLVKPGVKTPFAAVTFFDADKGIEISEKRDLAELSKAADSIIENKNIPYAIRVTGKFDYIKTRSVPRQEKPYRPLVEVTKDQSVFEMHDIEGTIVGFRVPEYMQGLNAAGHHLHFISSDKKSGGHLLGCVTDRVRIEVDDTRDFYMSLPETAGFSRLDLSDSQAKDIVKAEK